MNALVPGAVKTREEGIDHGQWLRRRAETAAWETGDWLNEGCALGYDVDFTLSAKITGQSKGHLYNLRRTAAAYPPHVRSYNLSLAVHLLLLRVTDEEARMELHAKAVEAHWTVDFARHALEELGVPKQVRRAQREDAPRVRQGSRRWTQARVCCPQCQNIFPIKGHRVTSKDIPS